MRRRRVRLPGISYAMCASDDDRPGYLDTTKGHLQCAVEALVS